MQADLFARPLLPGLDTRADFVTMAEERALIAAIDGTGLSPFRFQGWEGKRLTKSFGLTYDFEAGRASAAEAIPDWLEPVRQRAETFAGLPPGALQQALIIRYDPGAGIGWHRDRPMFDRVVGISLGNPAVMRFRRRTDTGFERANLPLDPRGAYLLTGEVRRAWEHSIVPAEATRWSITFRSLADPTAGRTFRPDGPIASETS